MFFVFFQNPDSAPGNTVSSGGQSDQIEATLEKILNFMKENDCSKRPAVSQPADNKEVLDKISTLSDSVQSLLQQTKSLTDKHETLKTNNEAVFSKIEDKFSNFYITQPTEEEKPSVLESSISKSLEEIAGGLNEIQNRLSQIPQQIISATSSVPSNNQLESADKVFIESLSNQTLAKIEEMKNDLLVDSEKNAFKATSRNEGEFKKISESVDEVNKNVADSADENEKLFKLINSSSTDLLAKLEVIDKFNNVLLVNSEYVLDTQRKVEFSSQKVIQKINDVIEKVVIELDAGIQKRFDNVDTSLLKNHVDSIANLSSTIENEISQIWRQIEVLNGDVADGRDILDKLNGGTEFYINGTRTTINGIEKDMMMVKDRTIDVQENLNDLLKRMSFINEDFKRMKHDLDTAFKEMRGNFKKEAPKGPGPHRINEDDYEINNELTKRNAQ